MFGVSAGKLELLFNRSKSNTRVLDARAAISWVQLTRWCSACLRTTGSKAWGRSLYMLYLPNKLCPQVLGCALLPDFLTDPVQTRPVDFWFVGFKTPSWLMMISSSFWYHVAVGTQCIWGLSQWLAPLNHFELQIRQRRPHGPHGWWRLSHIAKDTWTHLLRYIWFTGWWWLEHFLFSQIL